MYCARSYMYFVIHICFSIRRIYSSSSTGRGHWVMVHVSTICCREGEINIFDRYIYQPVRSVLHTICTLGTCYAMPGVQEPQGYYHSDVYSGDLVSRTTTRYQITALSNLSQSACPAIHVVEETANFQGVICRDGRINVCNGK